MKKLKRHYWLETWRETRCGIGMYDMYGVVESIKTTDHWDRVTCKACLKHRKPKVPKNGYFFCDTPKVMNSWKSNTGYTNADTEIWSTGSTWLY